MAKQRVNREDDVKLALERRLLLEEFKRRTFGDLLDDPGTLPVPGPPPRKPTGRPRKIG